MASYILGWLGIKGTAREGSVLSANQQWTLVDARVAYIDYAWTVNYLDGHQAVFNSKTLYLDSDMAGATVSLRETIVQGNGRTWRLNSEPTYIQNVNNAAVGTLKTAGVFDDHHTVSFSASNVRDADGLVNAQYSYAWQARNADGSWGNLAGSSASLQLKGLAGKEVRPVLSFTDDWGTKETIVGASHTVADANHAATGVLTATSIDAYGNVAFNAEQIRDADGLTQAKYAYGWQLHNADGSWSPLAGSARSINVSNMADGQELRPTLSFTDDQGNRETLVGGVVTVPTLPSVDLSPFDPSTLDRVRGPQTGVPFKLFDVGGQSIHSSSELVSLSIGFDPSVATLNVDWGTDAAVDYVRESSNRGDIVTFKASNAASADASFFEAILDHITVTKHTIGGTNWLYPPTDFSVYVEDVNHKKNWEPGAHAIF